MEREISRSRLQARSAGASIAVVGRTQLGRGFQFFRHRMRNAAGVNIHYAADGAGAVQERGRALQDFNALRQEGFDGRQVIRTGDRNVHRVDAVFHRLDPRAA